MNLIDTRDQVKPISSGSGKSLCEGMSSEKRITGACNKTLTTTTFQYFASVCLYIHVSQQWSPICSFSPTLRTKMLLKTTHTVSIARKTPMQPKWIALHVFSYFGADGDIEHRRSLLRRATRKCVYFLPAIFENEDDVLGADRGLASTPLVTPPTDAAPTDVPPTHKYTTPTDTAPHSRHADVPSSLTSIAATPAANGQTSVSFLSTRVWFCVWQSTKLTNPDLYTSEKHPQQFPFFCPCMYNEIKLQWK